MNINHRYEDLGFGITRIDNNPHQENMVANYLIQESNQVAFVDVGTSLSVPILLDVLKQKNIPFENVQYLLITHIHLDHAGGTGSILHYFPNAKVVLHPNAVRHIIRPEVLIASAKNVYGEEVFIKEYGEIIPVAPERIITIHDGLILHLQHRPLLFLDTPGHARHHYSVVDVLGKGIFAGDSFGVCYRFFDQGKQQYIYPATTPTQFNPDEYHQTIDRLVSYKLPYIYVTHFGRVENVEEMAKHLHQSIEKYTQFGLEVENLDERYEPLLNRIKNDLFQSLKEYGCTWTESQIWEQIGQETELNAKGILCWLDRRAKEQSK